MDLIMGFLKGYNYDIKAMVCARDRLFIIPPVMYLFYELGSITTLELRQRTVAGVLINNVPCIQKTQTKSQLFFECL